MLCNGTGRAAPTEEADMGGQDMGETTRPDTRLKVAATPLHVTYTNYRGETSVRRIVPLGAPVWQSTDWHPEPQWMLRAYDIDKGEEREFALKDFAIPASEQHAPGEARSYQARVDDWLLHCFGEAIARDREERNHRFIEEALETVQANGCTRSEAHQLVDYVFDRPVGELDQEVGGVMNTLAALCIASGVDLNAAAEKELARVWTKSDAIRAKQAAKPRHSPLPEHVPAPSEANGGAAQTFKPDPATLREVAKCIRDEGHDDPLAFHRSGLFDAARLVESMMPEEQAAPGGEGDEAFVERVQRVIDGKLGCAGGTDTRLVPTVWLKRLLARHGASADQVRADALPREPSLNMLEAGYEVLKAIYPHKENSGHALGQLGVWQAMYDCALIPNAPRATRPDPADLRVAVLEACQWYGAFDADKIADRVADWLEGAPQ